MIDMRGVRLPAYGGSHIEISIPGVRRWTVPLVSIGLAVSDMGRVRPHLGSLLPYTRCLCSNSRSAVPPQLPHPVLLVLVFAGGTTSFRNFVCFCCWCRSLCRHRSALVGQIDRLVPHRDLLVAHSHHLVPRLPAICRQLDRRLPIGDIIASIDSLGASFTERNSSSLMRFRPRDCAELAVNACRAVCAGPRLDVLLDVMRSSPEVLQFVPHICQHAEELGLHLEILADHIGDLGAYAATVGDRTFVPAQALTGRVHVYRVLFAAPCAHWLLERDGRLAQVLRACATGESAESALREAGWAGHRS